MTDTLQINDVNVSYGKTTILSDVRIPDIKPGSVVALLGRNAAGKSTLLKSLCGQLPYRGSVTLRGTELSELRAKQRVRQIGYLPQIPIQANGLLVWEIALSAFHTAMPEFDKQVSQQKIQQVFEQFDLMEFAFKPVDTLSGGKRQLLGLALIIARNTPLLLLDEPTSALDLHWQLETLNIVRDFTRQQNAISIVALHDVNLALRFCDEAILLGDGKVQAAGRIAEVITPATINRVYSVEARIESCSQGHPMVLVDKPIHQEKG